jgi:hypothetical protein
MTCPCLCHLIPSLKNHSTQAGVNNVSRLSHRFRAGVQQIPRPSDQVIPKCSKCYSGSNAFNISQCFRRRMLACLISISPLSSEKGIACYTENLASVHRSGKMLGSWPWHNINTLWQKKYKSWVQRKETTRVALLFIVISLNQSR